jgi:hypothetical protein
MAGFWDQADQLEEEHIWESVKIYSINDAYLGKLDVVLSKI